jgi:cellobiose phosphorylase
MPWVNVICNGRYGLVVSQNGGGFSWFDDAQHNVLTRWEMDLVRDSYGKFLFLADLESGEVWSAARAPTCKDYDEYSCVHTQGATTINARYADIQTAWTMSVATDDSVELWKLEITNKGSTPRRLRVSSFFEWCCNTAPDVKREFHRLFFTTAYNAGRSHHRRAIVATKNMWDIRPKTEREHWNVPWPYAAAHAVSGLKFSQDLAVADKSTFLGRYGLTAKPAAMAGAQTVDPSVDANAGGFGRFGDACAALGGDITLRAGETVTLYYSLAISTNAEKVLALVDRYADPSAVEAAITGAKKQWEKLNEPTHVRSEREDFNLLNNHWLPYQAISGRLWGRTGYYQQSGAFGFRDQLQDSQVWLARDPWRTLSQIMLHATRQFQDGSVYHWWHALADFGNHTACSDDYLWLPFLVAQYLKETGDFSALSRHAPFVDDPKGATLLDHCKRSIARTFKRTSARGLPFIGSCDWNDGLSAMGIDEKGESVWLGMFLCTILDDWAIILDRIGEKTIAQDYRDKRERSMLAINAHAWDGEWYKYGTKDSGEWIGSSANNEGKIHLNAQTWSILADIAPEDRAKQAWASVKKHLLSPYGPLLLQPAYTIPDTTIGYVTRYSPGSRENGGVYMHAATWALMAACKIKDVETVGKIWRSISPATRGQGAESYWAEPYVMPGNVDGPLSDKPGRAGWTWYTGSAAWLNRVSLEWVLGARPVWVNGSAEGLCIDPCPPSELGKVTLTRVWRGRKIEVSFDAGQFVAGRVPSLRVDGKDVAGNVLLESMLPAAGGGFAKNAPASLPAFGGTPSWDMRSMPTVKVEVSWATSRVSPSALAGAGRTTP